MTETLLTRDLAARRSGSLTFLEALRWDTPLGTGLRLYVGRGSEIEMLNAARSGPVRLTGFQRYAGCVIATGTAPAGQGPVTLDLRAESHELDTVAPETGLFEDLDVLLAQRHRESADQVATWLDWHLRTHGASGALILDRAEPGSDTFAADLAAAAAAIDGLRRIVVVRAPLPLGRPDQPALGHPALAPRARDRRADPDPWRAPLNEPVVYDALRWRFLSLASAVIALDPCDMLCPPEDGIGAFEAVRQSHTGLMPVKGQAVFPWRVRKGQPPHLGDHVCRVDPPEPAPIRWAVAPRRLGAETMWLPNSVAGVSALADEVLGYDRAMSVLFPEAAIPTLVDKQRLEPDPALFARARDDFGRQPIQPPTRPAAATPMPFNAPPSGRTVLITCMKNEGPFLLEWIAYHRMIGVDDFLVYTNDCADGTDTMLDRLEELGHVQRRDNPFRQTGAKPQHAALDAARQEPVVRNAGWIGVMDVDEFINVHAGANRLPDLYAAIGDANMVSMTWRLFGNSDIDAYADLPVIQQFTRCAPQLIRRPHQAWGIKTLFRNLGMWETFGVHRPRNHRAGAIDWVNGSGRPMPQHMLKAGWRSGIDSYGYDLVTLNHYAVRSAESFLVKRDRGRVNHVDRDQGEAYWFRMNNNDEQDLSIQRHVHGLQDELDALKRDDELAALHEAAVAWHRSRIAALRRDPDHAALFEKITGDRMKRLSRLHRHFGMNVFLHGPSVVPDSVLGPDLPQGFFFNTAPPEGQAAE